MIYAIVSDIHANLQAWNAVLDDMQKYAPDSVLCLGDIVGYGPLPAEVFESVCEHVDDIVIGNHDAVVCDRSSSENFNDNAKRVIDWTKNQLTDDVYDFFSGLAADLDGETFSMAHAELGDPERFDYIESEEMARETLSATNKPIVFIGHTHTPVIFVMDQESDKVLCHAPSNFALLEDTRYIVNVGSVGDPRSQDLRASYCIYDSDLQEIFFRRVPFDIEAYRTDMLKTTLPAPPFFMTMGQNLDDYKPATVAPAKRPIIVHHKKRTTIKRIEPVLLWEEPNVQIKLKQKAIQTERANQQEQEEVKKRIAAGLKAVKENQQAARDALKNAHLEKIRKIAEQEEAKKELALNQKKKIQEKIQEKQAIRNAKKKADDDKRLNIRQLLEKKRLLALQKKHDTKQIQLDEKNNVRIESNAAKPEATMATQSQTINQTTPSQSTSATKPETTTNKLRRIQALRAAAALKEEQRKEKIRLKKEKDIAARASAQRIIEMRRKKALEEKKKENED